MSVQQLLYIWLLVLIPLGVAAQKVDSSVATSSSWQYIRIQRSGVSTASISGLLTFIETFTTNQNHWTTGKAGEFEYNLTRGGYSIRRTGKRAGKSARTFINLPDSLDLNRAGTFIIEVDMSVPKGISPESGLLLGVRDEANYTLFVLRGKTEFMLKRVVNGTAGPANLSGTYQSVGQAVTVDSERNTLRIEKHDGNLFFAINGQDVPGDPTPFRKFKGNGIGFISSASEVVFQNLRISIGTL